MPIYIKFKSIYIYLNCNLFFHIFIFLLFGFFFSVQYILFLLFLLVFHHRHHHHHCWLCRYTYLSIYIIHQFWNSNSNFFCSLFFWHYFFFFIIQICTTNVNIDIGGNRMIWKTMLKKWITRDWREKIISLSSLWFWSASDGFFPFKLLIVDSCWRDNNLIVNIRILLCDSCNGFS